MKKEGCIFCAIASGESPAAKLWEDEHHLAFLSIFPNTKGFSVVIPKEHHESYFAEAPEETVRDLISAARTVAKMLDAGLDDVARTALVFEGYGVDHLHVKLIPLHGTTTDEWKAWREKNKGPGKYFEHYEGYVSSHDYERADDAELTEIAKRIRGGE